jgi:hypothetical protein
VGYADKKRSYYQHTEKIAQREKNLDQPHAIAANREAIATCVNYCEFKLGRVNFSSKVC